MVSRQPDEGVRSMREAQATPTVFSLNSFRDSYRNYDRNIDNFNS